MRRAKPIVTSVGVLAVAVAALAWVSSAPTGMHTGPVNAKSLGQMAFGPKNVLFIGDNDNASIHAVQITDASPAGGAIELAGIDAKVAQVMGTTPQDIAILDMAVHPASHNVYLTVRRGRGADAKYALLRTTRDAAKPLEEVSLDNVTSSSAPIANAPASNPGARSDPRTNTITDIAYAEGRVWVAGLSNEEFSSAFRQLPYPFGSSLETTALQIYHVSHKRSETQAPVMAFLPEKIDGKLYILAAYTCTPLVTFEVGSLQNGQKVVGRTVAELGAGNQPADMISYTREGKDIVLVANRTHPMMKLNAADFVLGTPLVNSDMGDGIARTPVSAPGAIVQLADFDKDYVVVIQKNGTSFDLKSIAKSTF